MNISKVKQFLSKKDIEISKQRYAFDAFSALALGLFSSLLIGTFLKSTAQILLIFFPHIATFAELLKRIGESAVASSGSAMAIAIGYSLSAPPLVLFSLAAVGKVALEQGGTGGALSVFVVSLLATECGKLISKESRFDFMITPLITTIVGVLLSFSISPWIGQVANQLGFFLIHAVETSPIIMGGLVALFMGLALTCPLSSAALAAALGLQGLAGAASLAGCCAQMIGFATLSFPENKWSGFLAQGLGSSMFQFKNIVNNPLVLLPPSISSIITGMLVTTLFPINFQAEPIMAGMGTSGLVGPLAVITAQLSKNNFISPLEIFNLILICFVFPILLNVLLGIYFRKKQWIKKGDLTLKL